MNEILFRAVEEYLAVSPDDPEWAEKAVAPFRDMTPYERLHAQSILNGRMDVLLAGRMPERDDGEPPFWMLWKDPVGARRRWEEESGRDRQS